MLRIGAGFVFANADDLHLGRLWLRKSGGDTILAVEIDSVAAEAHGGNSACERTDTADIGRKTIAADLVMPVMVEVRCGAKPSAMAAGAAKPAPRMTHPNTTLIQCVVMTGSFHCKRKVNIPHDKAAR